MFEEFEKDIRKDKFTPYSQIINIYIEKSDNHTKTIFRVSRFFIDVGK